MLPPITAPATPLSPDGEWSDPGSPEPQAPVGGEATVAPISHSASSVQPAMLSEKSS